MDSVYATLSKKYSSARFRGVEPEITTKKKTPGTTLIKADKELVIAMTEVRVAPPTLLATILTFFTA
jgi:hypothetical protein